MAQIKKKYGKIYPKTKSKNTPFQIHGKMMRDGNKRKL
jgi:hypothetical protein